MNDNVMGSFFGAAAATVVLGVITLFLLWNPIVGPWAEERRGMVELHRAKQNRQIQIEEAKTKVEVARTLADAEVIKANGVSRASGMMAGHSEELRAYIHLKYIEMLEATAQGGNTIIYIPTEAAMPILDVGRIKSAAPAFVLPSADKPPPPPARK